MMTLGLIGVMALLALVLAVPAVAHRAYWPGWDEGATSSQVTADQASAAATGWLTDNGYTDLVVAEIVDIDGRFYVVVKDAEGKGAFELFVSRNGIWVRPAPTMMWNTDYQLMTDEMTNMPHGMPGCGDMDGTMDRDRMQDRDHVGHHDRMQDRDRVMDPADCQGTTVAPAEPLAEPLTVDAAQAAAQAWLDAIQAGATATAPVEFPGYVTLRVSQDGAVNGLIAVQTTTGAIWPLQWPVNQ
jgi:hypothetical protein